VLLPTPQQEDRLGPTVSFYVEPEVRDEPAEVGGCQRRVHGAVRGAFALVHLQLEWPLPTVAEHLEEDAQRFSSRTLGIG
jgi:hypothetical protein